MINYILTIETIEASKSKVLKEEGSYASIDDGVSAFIHSATLTSTETYMTGNKVSVMDLDREISRYREISTTLTRFKMGEIKKARFETRTTVITLKRDGTPGW